MRYINATRILIITFLTTFAVIHTSYAQELELNTSSKAQIEYQPFSGFPASATINAQITFEPKNEDSVQIRSSRFRLRIKPSQGAFIATNEKGQTLPIEFSSRQNSARIQKIGNQYIEDINLDLDRQKKYTFDYLVSLTQSQFASPGVYRLLLDIDLVTFNTNQVVSNEEIVEVEVIVRPKVQANIAGTRTLTSNSSKFAIIDFGELESNESQTVFLQVQGNTDVNITLTSENQGRLKHREHQLFIDYRILFDGTKSKLKSPLNLKRSVAKNLRGSSYPMMVTIDNVTGAFSGRYRDIITIDVDPE